MNDGSGFLVGLFISVVLAFVVFLSGFFAGVNSYQRHLCETNGYDWINEEPTTQPVEGITTKVTCVEPIQRIGNE